MSKILGVSTLAVVNLHGCKDEEDGVCAGESFIYEQLVSYRRETNKDCADCIFGEFSIGDTTPGFDYDNFERAVEKCGGSYSGQCEGEVITDQASLDNVVTACAGCIRAYTNTSILRLDNREVHDGYKACDGPYWNATIPSA